MTLEDFERELAAQKEAGTGRRSSRDQERSDRHNHRHHHHHHRSRHGRENDEDGHRSKRRRRDSDDKDREGSRRERRRHLPTDQEPEETQLKSSQSDVKRDSWMEAPPARDVELTHKKQRDITPPRRRSLGQDYQLKLHKNEINHHLKDLQNRQEQEELRDEPAKHNVDYTIGDAGSDWRMTRLKAVYRQAEKDGRRVEDVALERYGSVREFDDAREEEIELERRSTYGPGYVGKDKPNGDLFEERKLNAGVHKPRRPSHDSMSQGQVVSDIAVPTVDPPKTDQTSLNKLKAQVMKAHLRNDPKAAELQKEYDALLRASQNADPTIITLSAMDSRMLSSVPRNETKAVTTRRGMERGNLAENEDMTIEDMVAEERRTRTQAGGEAQRFAERIAKDGKFDNDLEYMDENANKLAARVHKSDMNLRNIAINEYQKVNRILENCPLCHHEDSGLPPAAPIVSLATRTYLTLPTQPELAKYSAMIVPMQHHTNLLHADDDEWEEIRNFMKSLTRFYHDRSLDVLFYENAAHPHRRPHAALTAIPIPQSLSATAPAFFQEAFLTTEDEWSQHKKIIDTLKASKDGSGRTAFKRMIAKEMPYFHVWFELNGGIGHIVEDPDKWPRGDLFAREVVGGMLGLETEIVRKQGRWTRGADKDRVESFRKRWHKFDWTRVLTSEG